LGCEGVEYYNLMNHVWFLRVLRERGVRKGGRDRGGGAERAHTALPFPPPPQTLSPSIRNVYLRVGLVGRALDS